MNISFIFRKKNPRFFSIERVFGTVISHLKGCAVEEVEMPEFGLHWKNFLALYRYSRKRRSAIFHITGDNTYLAMVLPRKRTVVTFHDSVFLHEYSGFKRFVLGTLFIRIPIRWAGYITTISEASKQELVKYSNCRPERIRVIGNPLVSRIPRIHREMDPERPVLLFVGVTRNKNLERVAAALQGIPCHLQVIGDPDEGQKLALKAQGISYEYFTGLTDEEVAQKYVSSDIVLFPTLYEGFGLPILEGFQAGRTVITSDREPMRSVAGGAALLVDPEQVTQIREAVLLVIGSRDLREGMRERGYLVVEAYQPEAVAQKYMHVYQAIASEAQIGN